MYKRQRLLRSNRVRLFAQSTNIQQRLIRFGNHQSELLYPPPPQRKYRFGEYPPVILYVGRLHTMKRVDLLIRSFSRAADFWRLIIIGRGPEAGNLHRLADQLEVSQRISWMEDINDEEATHPYLIISSKNHSDGEIEELLAEGNPSVRVRNGFDTDGVKVFTSNLQEGEAKIIAQKILDALS